MPWSSPVAESLGSFLVTTYTLRKGSPAKTRTDLVVVGVARSPKGDLVPASGAGDVADAYGRKFKPLLTSMGFKGDAGEVLRLPAGDAINAGQLLVIGLGARDSLTVDKVRRAAGVASRNLGNAASVALAARIAAGDVDLARAAGPAAGDFPPLVAWMLGPGHQRGDLAAGLRHLGVAYRRAARRRAETFRVLLPGVLIVALGSVAVLAYCLVLFIPLRQLWDGLAVPS